MSEAAETLNLAEHRKQDEPEGRRLAERIGYAGGEPRYFRPLNPSERLKAAGMIDLAAVRGDIRYLDRAEAQCLKDVQGQFAGIRAALLANPAAKDEVYIRELNITLSLADRIEERFGCATLRELAMIPWNKIKDLKGIPISEKQQLHDSCIFHGITWRKN